VLVITPFFATARLIVMPSQTVRSGE
jgi:hypothetical protein